MIRFFFWFLLTHSVQIPLLAVQSPSCALAKVGDKPVVLATPWPSGIDTFQMSSSPWFHTPVAHSHVISPQRTWFADSNVCLARRIIGLTVVSVLCGPMQKLSYVKITWLAACPSSNPDSALILQRLFEAPIAHTLPVDATNDNDQGLLIGRRAVVYHFGKYYLTLGCIYVFRTRSVLPRCYLNAGYVLFEVVSWPRPFPSAVRTSCGFFGAACLLIDPNCQPCKVTLSDFQRS